MKAPGGFGPAELYRRYLRKYALIRLPKSAVFHGWHFLKWRIVRPMVRALVPRRMLAKLHIYRTLGGGSLWAYFTTPALPLVPLARAKRAATRELFEGARVNCSQPVVFPVSLKNCVPVLASFYEVPPVSLVGLNDAEIDGRSNMVFMPDCVVHHDLYHFQQDLTSEELHGRLSINPKLGTAKRYARSRSVLRMGSAAGFTDSVASNYAHWLTEVLPRIHAYSLGQRDPLVPLVLDQGLHHNLLRSAELVSHAGSVFYELPADSALAVGSFDLVSRSLGR